MIYYSVSVILRSGPVKFNSGPVRFRQLQQVGSPHNMALARKSCVAVTWDSGCDVIMSPGFTL